MLFFSFLFGLAIGSFLNALDFRMEKGKTVLKGRSFCPQCSHSLSPGDLIPLVSFVLLKGKCRYCNRSISFQYPLVEFSVAVLFVLIVQFAAFSFLSLLFYWTITALLVAIFVYDFKHLLIPDILIYSAIVGASLWALFFGDIGFWVAALGAGLFFLSLFLMSRGRWMGFGDVKLAFFMGLFLSWPAVLVAFFATFFTGSVVGIALILLKKKGMKSEIPFGPFLVSGIFIALFWGEQIVDWYLFYLI